MSANLLEKEQEYHKINAQVEQKTKELMCETESLVVVVNGADTGCVEQQHNDGNDTWDGLPDSCKDMGRKDLMQFLKCKINILQNDVNVFRVKYKSRCDELKQLQVEFDRMQTERNKWKRMAESNKELKEKLSNQMASLQCSCEEKDLQLANLKRENESIKKEQRNRSAWSANQEVRLNNAVVQLDKLKVSLTNCRKTEKEQRHKSRKEVAELTARNTKLERQTDELTCAFKKQLLLIDNLKKQKVFLEALKITQIVEDEFLKVLDLKIDTGSNVV